MSTLQRPDPSEHADHYSRYVDLVPEGDIVELLADELGETLALLQGVPADRETYRYADGKWSVREVVGHVIDVERVFAFRALSMARCDGVDLPGMDQDEWMVRAGAHQRSLDEMGAEWAALRRANIHMFASMDEQAGERTGRASGCDFTVRSFPWIIAGHELWHREGLRRDYGLTEDAR